MTTGAWKAFLTLLQREWLPLLARAGFRGDGKRFQRALGEVIQVIGLQNSKYGGSCCVNLGLHLSFLPLGGGDPPAAGAAVRVESCEFQWRLAPAGHTDYWWAYEPNEAAHLPYSFLHEANHGPQEQARHLASIYQAYGEPAFQRLATVGQVAGLIRLEDLDKIPPIVPEYAFTPGRAGLTMARIHLRLGDREQAQRFAQAGLQRIGKAKALREELERLSGAG